MKTIEEQRKKQKSNRRAMGKTISFNEDDDCLPYYERDKDSEIVLKQRKIFEELYSKRTERINRFFNQISFNNLVWTCKSSNTWF